MTLRKSVAIVILMLGPTCGVRGQTPPLPRFDVASVKPSPEGGQDIQGLGTVRTMPGGHLIAEKAQLRYLIRIAYGLKPFEISGGPGWIDSAHYDIDAKAEGNPSGAQISLMTQALLADRFQFKAHRETKEIPIYELSVSKAGVKLQPPKPGSCTMPDPNAPPLPPAPGQPTACGRVLMMMSPSGARMMGGNVLMPELIRVLSNVLGRTVVDRTGFAGSFDVHLEFTPDLALAGLPRPPAPADTGTPATPPDPVGPSIFAALQEQLGLKLDSVRGPVEILVIDRVERPTGN